MHEVGTHALEARECSQRRAVVAVALLLLSASPAGSTASEYEIDVTAAPYNAVCDGATDDARAIQSAIDAAEMLPAALVRVPARTCAIATTLVVNNTSTQRFVSIRGVNPTKSILRWIGPARGGVALTIAHNLNFRIENLGIHNGAGGEAEDSVGLLLTGDADQGTRTYGALISHLHVIGFATCVQAGQYTNFAASEIIWTHFLAQQCKTGWRNGSLNTLNHSFYMAQGTQNTVTAFDIGSGNVSVHSGAMSGNAIDFDVSNAGFTLEVANVRSENAGTFLRVTPSGRQNIALRNNRAGSSTRSDEVLISLSGNELTTLDNNQFAGKVYVRDGGGSGELRMTGNMVYGDRANDTPFWMNAAAFSNGHLRFVSYQNQHWSTAEIPSDYTYPYEIADISGPRLAHRATHLRVPQETGAAAVNALELLRVRSLAQGSMVAGRNLRLQERFDASGSKTVTFVRSVSINVATGSSSVSYAAGAVNAADLGKKITILAADGRGGTITGRIRELPSRTTMELDHLACGAIGCSPGLTGRVTALIGENEPDAHYMLTIGCNAQEIVSWSAKATTGFTMTSSNGKSTATCDIVIVR